LVVAKTYRLGLWRRVVNEVVKGLLRVGLGPRHTYLLTAPGRRTGRLYSTPVTLVEDGGQRWLVAPYGEVAWVRNARASKEVTLSRGRRFERVVLFDVEPAEAAPVLKRYATQVPITRPFFDVKPDSSLDAFAAEASRHPVFRLVPEDDP
jgi:deazaflavin-dependent oxidoreductase (nitroreductase family)